MKEKRKNKQKDVYKIVDIPEKNLSIYGKKIRVAFQFSRNRMFYFTMVLL